jgi:hypothetical protein
MSVASWSVFVIFRSTCRMACQSARPISLVDSMACASSSVPKVTLGKANRRVIGIGLTIPGRREVVVRHQAADGISPVNAARTASSRSASVKPRCSCRRATTRSTKTPRFSNGTRSAAVQTVRSCESVKATMQPWSSRRDGCQRLPVRFLARRSKARQSRRPIPRQSKAAGSGGRSFA